MQQTQTQSPASWKIILAFAAIYLSWGTTYFAIKLGVKSLPPLLFGGVRIGLAGLLILGYLVLRGQPVRLPAHEWRTVILVGLFLFLGGNGLITVAEKTVDSGVASVLVASTPVWLAILETMGSKRDRLNGMGWLGVLAGLAGVLLILSPRLHDPSYFIRDLGPLFVLGSAFAWAVGSHIMRSAGPSSSGSHLTSAAFQMMVGSIANITIGLLLGEAEQIKPEIFTPQAVGAFFYLLIVGSLIGFVAYNWLLGHVPATLVGTYAYVNPVVAILVAALIAHEEIPHLLLVGMVVILIGVALVRAGHQTAKQNST